MSLLARCSLVLFFAVVGVTPCVGSAAASPAASFPVSTEGARRLAADSDTTQGRRLWYERFVERDVTDDGRADTLLLRAYGTRGDSLRMLFVIVTEGREVFRATWLSGSDLIGAPLPPNPPRAVVDSYMRSTLDGFFNHLTLAPLDTSSTWGLGSTDCREGPAECRAIEADIRRNTKYQLHVAYGYEANETIAWSTRAHRFFIIGGCC